MCRVARPGARGKCARFCSRMLSCSPDGTKAPCPQQACRWGEIWLDTSKPAAFGKLAHARECRHSPAAPEYSGHIPNGPACDAGDPTTPNGFLAPHDARTGSIRPGSRHRAPKRHCPVRTRHGALSSPRFPLCDPGVAAVPWRRAARCSQLLRTRRRSVAIHSTWKAAVRTAVD